MSLRDSHGQADTSKGKLSRKYFSLEFGRDSGDTDKCFNSTNVLILKQYKETTWLLARILLLGSVKETLDITWVSCLYCFGFHSDFVYLFLFQLPKHFMIQSQEDFSCPPELFSPCILLTGEKIFG